MFKRIVVAKNTQDFANTDYYAYLLGILSFSNPESTNINVFATSSIDYVNNSNLVDQVVNMIQFSRADSVYIATTPDYPMYQSDSTDPELIIQPQEAVDNLDNTGLDSNYTATYYPWILVRDTVNNTQLYLPPTGEVCRNLALTDNIAFPWFASAGYTRGLVNSVKARVKLTQEGRDILYQGRINPIATFSDVGTVIWGNKTLQVADSALNRLNVRRLLLQARKLISAVAIRLLFEQNDQIVRQQFLDSVNPILDSIRRDRGLYDFRVTVSSSPEDLDRNTLTGRIYLKPTKALEFIEIEFLITPTGASFENI
jgi:phage tail sheath protein FI